MTDDDRDNLAHYDRLSAGEIALILDCDREWVVPCKSAAEQDRRMNEARDLLNGKGMVANDRLSDADEQRTRIAPPPLHESNASRADVRPDVVALAEPEVLARMLRDALIAGGDALTSEQHGEMQDHLMTAYLMVKHQDDARRVLAMVYSGKPLTVRDGVLAEATC